MLKNTRAELNNLEERERTRWRDKDRLYLYYIPLYIGLFPDKNIKQTKYVNDAIQSGDYKK